MNFNIIGGSFKSGMVHTNARCEFFIGDCVRLFLPDGSSTFYKLKGAIAAVEDIVEDKSMPTIKVTMSDGCFFIAKTSRKSANFLKVCAAHYNGVQGGAVASLPALTPGQEWKRLTFGTKIVRLFGMLSLGFIAFIIVSAFLKEPTEQERLQIAQDVNRAEAITICQMRIQKMLKSPGSASFPWGPDVVVSGNTYTVSSYVDAKNSFNADIRNHYICQLELLGNDPGERENWKIKKLTFLK